MIWPAIIGAVGAIGGGLLSSQGSKDAAGEASAGSLAEINYNRQTRDLIRQDQEPYRQAGYSALNALMSMTGLPAIASTNDIKPVLGRVDARQQATYGPNNRIAPAGRASSYRPPSAGQYIDPQSGALLPIKGAYAGGPTSPETIYNVSEIGPENVYTKGRMTRPQNPSTIEGETGYVEPNIEGRITGGAIAQYRRRGDVMLGGGPEGTAVGGYGGGFGGPGAGGGQDRLTGGKISYPGMVGGDPRIGPPKVPGGPSAGRPPGAIDPATGYPYENPGGTEGGYNFMTDPGYEFRFKEGMRALDRGAAARGGLLSGGYGRRAIRYGQDYASGEYTNVYNRIANIAGLGQTANQTNASAALQTGANMGTAAAQAGYARASGYQAAGNAWANAGNQIAQLPWDQYIGG